MEHFIAIAIVIFTFLFTGLGIMVALGLLGSILVGVVSLGLFLARKVKGGINAHMDNHRRTRTRHYRLHG